MRRKIDRRLSVFFRLRDKRFVVVKIYGVNSHAGKWFWQDKLVPSMRAPLLLATDKKPGLQTYLGPRGPSGVMKMSEVCWSVSTIEIIACAPLLLLEPLTVPMPRNLKNAQSQAPSRLALTRPDIGKFGLKIYLHMGRKKILLCHARPIRRFLSSRFSSDLASEARMRIVACHRRTSRYSGNSKIKWRQVGCDMCVCGSMIKIRLCVFWRGNVEHKIFPK